MLNIIHTVLMEIFPSMPNPVPVPLTAKDWAVLSSIRKGAKYQAIALDVGCSTATIKRRIKRLYHQLGVADRIDFLNRYGEFPADGGNSVHGLKNEYFDGGGI